MLYSLSLLVGLPRSADEGIVLRVEVVLLEVVLDRRLVATQDHCRMKRRVVRLAQRVIHVSE